MVLKMLGSKHRVGVQFEEEFTSVVSKQELLQAARITTMERVDLAELKASVLAGVRPSGPMDWGPFTALIQAELDFFGSGVLLKFSGRLDDRFIPVHSLAHAEEVAFNPRDDDFQWNIDREAEAEKELPPFVFEDPIVFDAFKQNLNQLELQLARMLTRELPRELLGIYDEVLLDLCIIIVGLAKFGEHDDPLFRLIRFAYAQGGWPCGLTGPRPDSRGHIDLEGRKMYVYWKSQ